MGGGTIFKVVGEQAQVKNIENFCDLIWQL